LSESGSVIPPWSGSLGLATGMVVYMGPGGRAAFHGHHAIQLIRSFDSPFSLTIGGETVESHAALIPSGVRHGFDTESRRLFLALIEPLGPRGGQIEAIARDPAALEPETLAGIEPLEGEPGVALGGRLLERIVPRKATPARLSEHVLAALTHLERNLAGRPTLSGAAKEANISPSRLTHLFTEQVGIPFRSYVLWLRLRTVAERVAEGSNLTDAAHSAGFSDSSHLSRVFRDNFGLAPSALLRMKVDGGGWPT